MRTSWPPPRRARAKPARCAALVVSGSWARARWLARVTSPITETAKQTLRMSCAPLAYGDRKSTRLNSSHGYISYAVFCLKKKKEEKEHKRTYGRSEHSVVVT